MAASSLINFSLSFHRYRNQTPKSPLPTIRNPSKTLILNSSSSYHHLLRQIDGKVPISLRPAFSPPPQKKIFTFFVEKIATLLLGSLVFMGSMKARPAFAVPIQENEVFEEKIDDGISNDEGEEMCERLLQENPNDLEAMKMILNVKMRREKTGEAVKIVERLIELQPNEMEWRLLQALCYEMMGDLSKAKSFFTNILDQQPLLLRALHGLGMVMHKNQEGAAVFEMLERAIEIARKDNKVNEERNIRILIAQMHLIKGELEEALKKFQALIDENPRDFRPYLCQGIVYSLLDKKTEAEASFEIYHSLVPQEFPQRGYMDDVVLAARTE